MKVLRETAEAAELPADDVGLGEFCLELFTRRRDRMSSVSMRRLDSMRESGWESMFGTFVVLEALKACDLRAAEIGTAIRLAQQGQFAESSDYVLGKLLSAVLHE